MSYEKIENTLFNLKMAVWHISDGRTAENLIGDIAWYIQTGRASCDYIRAFAPCQNTAQIRLHGKY